MDIADQVLTDLAKGEEGLGRSKAHKVKRHALRRAAKRLVTDVDPRAAPTHGRRKRASAQSHRRQAATLQV